MQSSLDLAGALPAAEAASSTLAASPVAVSLPYVTSPFDAGSRSQLFADQVLVRSASGISFAPVPGRPHPDNPVLKADQPWEGWHLELMGSVHFDPAEKRFRMWYLAAPSEYFGDYVTAYATSTDGVHWEKPLVGTVPAKNGKPHNVVLGAGALSVMRDDADPDPERRYKGVSFLAQHGAYYSLISPDGLHWRQYSEQPIVRGRDCIAAYQDRRSGLYVVQAKIEQPLPNLPHKRRAFYQSVSADFIHWTDLTLSLAPDPRDDAGSFARIEAVRPLLDVPDDPALMRTEIYSVGFYPTESCTIGFPWVFTVSGRARYDTNNQEGPGEVQMAVTRDLLNWERPFRTPVIARGPVGAWDSGFFTTASEAVEVGDEVWLYYAACNYTHGTPVLYRDAVDGQSTGRGTRYTTRIGLATWRRDRFAAAEAGASGGTLTTVPLTFSGSRLEVNAATNGHHGSVQVELCDALGEKTLARSRAFSGDDLRHRVTWETPVDLTALAGKPVTLRFLLKDARLYAFAFRA